MEKARDGDAGKGKGVFVVKVGVRERRVHLGRAQQSDLGEGSEEAGLVRRQVAFVKAVRAHVMRSCLWS